MMGRNQKRGTEDVSSRDWKCIWSEVPALTEYPEERETLCIGAFGKEESFFTLKGMA